MRRFDEPIPDLAALLEPEPEPALQLDPSLDFAFAPTVQLRDIDLDSPPPSGPIFARDPAGNRQCVTPFAFPLPPSSEETPVTSSVRLGVSRARRAAERAWDEILELWAGTREVTGSVVTGGPVSRGLLALARARVLWSFWEWDRADVARAAVIGTAVFAAVVLVGASVVVSGGGGANASASASNGAEPRGEVRGARTLDQHTGRAGALRTKR